MTAILPRRLRIAPMVPAAKLFVSLGAIAAALGVALGAFGAHALKARLSADMLAVWQTAVQYHLWHALGLIGIGLLAQQLPASGPIRLGGWLLLAGIVLFSGSLYVLAASGARWLGAVTPFGGACFIVGWLAVAYAVLRQ
jgi:uncharacterized membrane protein YgdD (TMEM256/DUF423 family)